MGVKKQLCGHGDPLLMEASKMHTTTKPTRGYGDPLLMEVVTGLKETLASIHDEKTLGGARGVGERTFSKGMTKITRCPFVAPTFDAKANQNCVDNLTHRRCSLARM